MLRLASLLFSVLCLSATARADAPSEPDKGAAPEEPDEPLSLEALLDIVVTATLRAQAKIDAPASMTVVGAAEIRARGYRTLKDVMNDVPGFNDVADVNEEIAGVRGVFASTTNKILILVNGHRMNDLMLGRYNVDQYLGMAAVERIELVRGPVSALYGTGALVGVVNVITKKGADQNGFEAGVRAGRAARELHASWGRALGGYDLYANFTFLDAPGQRVRQPAALDVVPAGQEPSPGQVYLGRYPENLSGLFTLRGDSAALTVRAAHFRRVPPRAASGSLYDADHEPFAPAYTENDFFADHAQSFALGPYTRLTLNPSVHFFSYYEQSFMSFGANRAPPLGERSGMQGEFANYGAKVGLEHTLAPYLDLTAGLDGILASFYRSDAVTVMGNQVVLTPEGYTETGRWFLAGAFLQAIFTPIPIFSLTVGARFDTFGGEADPELTPRLGLVLRPSETLAVKALYGRSYLAPMWAHKRANDGNFLGSPDLGPESVSSGSLIVAYGGRHAAATAEIFYNDVDGLINAIPRTPPAPGMAFDVRGDLYNYQNSGDGRYYGVELSGEVELARWLRLDGSWAHLRADVRRTSMTLLLDDRIKNIAPHTWRYGLRLEPLAGLQISLWGRAYAATATADVATGATRIPAVALFDASIAYAYRGVLLQLTARNLSNRKYERGGTTVRPLARERIDIEGTLSLRF